MAVGFVRGVILCCYFTSGMLAWQLSVRTGTEYLAEFSVLSGKDNVLFEKLLLPDGHFFPDEGWCELCLYRIHDE